MHCDYCRVCGDEIMEYDLVSYEGMPVHADCFAEIGSMKNAMEYAKSYPEDFFDYLQELLICTDCPELTAGLEKLLTDFRDNWGGRKPFTAWIADNSGGI